MAEELSTRELVDMVRRVFRPGLEDRNLAIMVDLPDEVARDNPEWRDRREMAAAWAARLSSSCRDAGLEQVSLLLYRNSRAGNADLPAHAVQHAGGALPATAEELRGALLPFERIFETFQLLIAPTEFSATAPLKVAAKRHGFRAATMPGFTRAMIPALRLDYGVIARRVDRFKEMLDRAERCDIVFDAAGSEHRLVLDLRHREAHASGGLLPEKGTAGNLPSGESYVVPYEGEIPGDPTASAGEIPVQLGEDIVIYRVRDNVAIEVLSDNAASRSEAARLRAEPAYGNIAELGLGVLGDFGLEPTGAILLDEKLGLHIAFGRSDHLGGKVGPDRFSRPESVVHIDRVYLPSLQPDVKVALVHLTMEDGSIVELMRDGHYVVALDG
ncbi:MAG: hypothetical protein AB1486_32415 [Planctomycetota bacterium]